MGFRNPELRTVLDINPARAMRNALLNQQVQQQNQLRGLQIEQAPAERNYLLEQRQNLREDRATAMQQRPIMDARSSEKFMAQAAPTFGDLAWLRSPAGRQRLEGELGLQGLPSDADLAQQAPEYGGEEQAWEAWKARYTAPSDKIPFDEQLRREGESQRQKLGIAQEFETPEVDQRAFETWQLPNGTTANIRKGDQPPVGAFKYKPGGEVIEVGPDGTFRISRGGAAGKGPSLTKKSEGALEAKFMNASNHLARIGEIKSRYKSEYLQAKPRLQGVWTSIKSKFGAKIPEREKSKLREQTAFLRTTISNLNKHIKEVTGAQMSEKEAGRIGLEEPKAGQSWFDFLWSGDSPIEFESKIEDIELTLRASMARTQWYLSKGMTYPEIAELVKADAAQDLEAIKDRMK